MSKLLPWISSNLSVIFTICLIATLAIFVFGLLSQHKKITFILTAVGILITSVCAVPNVINHEKDNSYYKYDIIRTRELTDSELESMSKEDIQKAINEIYAVSGHIFDTPAFQDYFSQKNWYEPKLKIENIYKYMENEYVVKNYKKLIYYREKSKN